MEKTFPQSMLPGLWGFWIVPDLGFLGLSLPLSGVFAGLVHLEIGGIHLHGPWCPYLQSLTVNNVRGLGNLTIHAVSLLDIDVWQLPDLQQLIVVAPALEELKVTCCFDDAPNPSQSLASISAPRLEVLVWMNPHDPSSVQLDEMTKLQWLGPEYLWVFGPDSGAQNRFCSRLLQHFQRLHGLGLTLVYPQVCMGSNRYLMEGLTKLPKIESLILSVIARDHSFGASSFHVLKMCTSIARLKLRLSDDLKEETVCPPDCICDQPPNWKTDELGLNSLEDLQISGLRGTEHEVAVVQRFFNWAKVLKRMTVHFHDSVTESKGKELHQLLLSFARPEICLNCNMY